MFPEPESPQPCGAKEARLEEYLEGHLAAQPAAELEAHLERCGACRAALEAAQASARLFHAAGDAEHQPRPWFAPRVMARIREQQDRRRSARAFWRPVEILAWRFSLVATLVLVAFAGYLLTPRVRQPAQYGADTELRELFPDPAPHPADRNEVLFTLASSSGSKASPEKKP